MEVIEKTITLCHNNDEGWAGIRKRKILPSECGKLGKIFRPAQEQAQKTSGAEFEGHSDRRSLKLKKFLQAVSH